MSSIPSQEAIRMAREARHGPELQECFSAASVAICGLGGLGSNLALCLARAGVGRLHLIDFDRVDLSNLHRQQYFTAQLGQPKTESLRDILEAAAPDVTVTIHTARVTDDNLDALLSDSQIVCEAFDVPEDKALLVNAVLERFPEKYVVAASGMAGLGPANDIRTRRITSHFYLCGDGISQLTPGDGLLPSRVMLCAAHQAHTVLRILAGALDV
ncbi:MAG: thiamine biosynthesis protein ThiF [Oscillospiraceae bacterium]|nr:thiamine biosynthesis protein ThiF [Oscillospiraceae bacterium]